MGSAEAFDAEALNGGVRRSVGVEHLHGNADKLGADWFFEAMRECLAVLDLFVYG